MGKGGTEKRKGEKKRREKEREGPVPLSQIFKFASGFWGTVPLPGLCLWTPMGTSVCQIPSLRPRLHNS